MIFNFFSCSLKKGERFIERDRKCDGREVLSDDKDGNNAIVNAQGSVTRYGSSPFQRSS